MLLMGFKYMLEILLVARLLQDHVNNTFNQLCAKIQFKDRQLNSKVSLLNRLYYVE